MRLFRILLLCAAMPVAPARATSAPICSWWEWIGRAWTRGALDFRDARFVPDRDIRNGNHTLGVAMRKGFRRLRFVFKYDMFSKLDRTPRDIAEIAAYHLDDEMGLGVVPFTQQAVVEGRRGSAQTVIEGAKHFPPSGPLDRRIKLLDFLTHNTDRYNGRNILIDARDRQWAIDNEKGFQAREAFTSDVLEILADDAQVQELIPDHKTLGELERVSVDSIRRRLMSHGLSEEQAGFVGERLEALRARARELLRAR